MEHTAPDQSRPDRAVKKTRHEILAHCKSYTLARLYAPTTHESKPHRHTNEQVIYVLSGRGEFCNGAERLRIKAGDCFSIEPDIPHCYGRLEEDITALEFFTPGREDVPLPGQ